MKAYSYVRVSGAAQVAGDGFPRQREAIANYAAANGIEIVREYAEEGVTGKMEAVDRPAWFAMLAAIKANGVRTIIIERLDRLARDLLVQEHIVRDLQHENIKLVSVYEPDLGSTDPTRVLMRQVMGAIAEYDRKMIVLKLRGARQRKKAATGKCEGAKPFGSHPDKPEESPVLQRIIAMWKSGTKYTHIAERLNAEQIPGRRGKWNPGTIYRIIRKAA